jgi:hypothetical protein
MVGLTYQFYAPQSLKLPHHNIYRYTERIFKNISLLKKK